MSFLPIFPALLAAYIALRYSAARAFLCVYIPVLLLLPMYYRWVIPVLPDPTFEQATILPIAGVFLLRHGLDWKFTFTDLLILGFAGCIGISEFLNTNYEEAQNLMFDMVASVILPYVLAKGLIEPQGLSVQLAKRTVLMLLAVSIVSVYEFRMGATPWILLRKFYPNQGLEWVTTFRYGFARVGGPYGHAILAGLMLAVGFRLQRWLEWSGQWEPRFRWLKWLKISKARLITIGLIGGMVMTMVRGPWIGGVAGALLTSVSRRKHRHRAMLVITIAVIVVGIPASSWFYAYAAVGRAHAKTQSQETAAYRLELLDKYVATGMKHAAWGYGRNTWPRVPGAPSIDNYYLLLFLMHGGWALGFLVIVMLGMIVRLVSLELKLPISVPLGGSLGFTLAGIFLLYAVTIATVYMGLQTIPMFAIITGWAEGYLIKNRIVLRLLTQPSFTFKRVVS
jgi:hypothetical protein